MFPRESLHKKLLYHYSCKLFHLRNLFLQLSESIKLTLTEWGTQNGVPTSIPIQNGVGPPGGPAQTSRHHSDYMVLSASAAPTPEAVINITRPHDDVQNKMAEEERKNLKIGVKIFINEDSTQALTECLENGECFCFFFFYKPLSTMSQELPTSWPISQIGLGYIVNAEFVSS